MSQQYKGRKFALVFCIIFVVFQTSLVFARSGQKCSLNFKYKFPKISKNFKPSEIAEDAENGGF